MESGSRPTFKDFLQFVKKRASLVNNEFGEDLCASVFKPKDGGRKRDDPKSPFQRPHSFVAAVYERQNSKDRASLERKPGNIRCLVCLGNHGIWKCDKFKKPPYQQKKKLVQDCEPNFKCILKATMPGHVQKYILHVR